MLNANSKRSILHRLFLTARSPSPTPLRFLLAALYLLVCASLLVLYWVHIFSLLEPTLRTLFSHTPSGPLICGHIPGLVSIRVLHYLMAHGVVAWSGVLAADLLYSEIEKEI